jgi:2-polyprenyl-3-methyl-5-hydroxy-6-metoxy-1,4-benzoquinol methylase
MSSRFDQRSSQIEIMDDLEQGGELIDQTLRELEIINRLLGGNKVTIDGISTLLKNKPEKTIQIADLGCGGGDILKLVAKWGRRNKIKFQLIGIDANPNIVVYAQNNSNGYPEIRYEAVNIFSSDFQKQRYDIVLATLFTHHFTNQQLTKILSSLRKQAAIGIVINDLHRHWFAYHSIKWLTWLFSRSSMVKSDAPTSVLRAFHKHELKAILENAGITNYTLRWRWAFRWELIIFS